MALVFLVGFRVGLNLTNSNVIDVGYSGVIGADRSRTAKPLRELPARTTGPATRTVRSATRRTCRGSCVLPWAGKWDELPAAHAAAVFFDLATMRLVSGGEAALAGRGGRGLGLVLAYAWAAYPYTLFVLSSNANDSLVALLVTLAFWPRVAAAGARRWRWRAPSSRRSRSRPCSAATTRRPGRARFAGVRRRDCLLWLPVLPDGGLCSSGTGRSGSSSVATRPSASGVRRTRLGAGHRHGARAGACARGGLRPAKEDRSSVRPLGAAVLLASSWRCPIGSISTSCGGSRW